MSKIKQSSFFCIPYFIPVQICKLMCSNIGKRHRKQGFLDWIERFLDFCVNRIGHFCKCIFSTNLGVWNRREIQLTRFALPYDYTCFADGYSICIRNIFLMYNYRVYNNLFLIFLIQKEYTSYSFCTCSLACRHIVM